jgi:adenine-specific DNA-methyltransferase
MSKKIEKLKTLLNELFRLDQPDLDFGIYRIMHARSEEITKYLEEGLLPQVKDAFEQYKSGDIDAVENEIKIAIKGARDAGFEPDESPRVIELRKKLADESIDLGSIENEVFNHLYNFFRRYYDKGDFLSKRIYKPGVYAVPYEGEEVKLYWANSDQYYVKTSEYLKNYSFCLQPDNDKNPMRVNFELIDADEEEHDSIKEQENNTRRFLLAPEPFCSVENNELIIRFTYEIESTKQNRKNDEIEQSILDLKDKKLTKWIEKLKMPHTRKDGIESANIRLRIHLDRYTKRNNSDYFIHKDLDGFLRRELDFYIKNEVMHLDDIENESVPKVEQYLSKIKVIRIIATKIIQFLAQIENFSKKLWLKKKFVVEANYCITLDRVPEELYSQIAANEAQCDEWINLFAIDEIERNLIHNGFSKPLSTEFLKANNKLVLDTRFFDGNFKARLVASIENFNQQCDGLLINSDNFQALNLLQERYREQVKCVYVDPPYNTGGDGFLYKDCYQHSSWMSMFSNRLSSFLPLASSDSVFFASIDDNEVFGLKNLLETYFGSDRFESQIIVQSNKRGQTYQSIAKTHEYLFCYLAGGNSEIDELPREISSKSLKDDIGPYELWELRNRNPKFGKHNRPNLYYPIYVDPNSCNSDGYAKISLEKSTHYNIEVLPKNSSGADSCWRWGKDKTVDGYSGASLSILVAKQKKKGGWNIYQKSRKGTTKAKSIWSETEVINEQGTVELGSMGFTSFGFPKPIGLLNKVLQIGAKNDSLILDYFAGTGTTGHAAINLNREDGGKRKYILVEVGHYFDTVMKPRIMKAIYSKSWKSGKPASRQTGMSHCFKYIYLESYEDTLNNLQLNRNDKQKSLLDFDGSKSEDEFKEQYLLNYMLELESAGSQSLMNISDFINPTEYKMNVKQPGSVESCEMNIDLVETFNWLIGITVKHISQSQHLTAEFERDKEGRLSIKGEQYIEESGTWWIRTITGTLPDGRQTLVIWRNRPGGEDTEGVERDNLMLNEWFSKQEYDDAEEAFNFVYVNGSNNLEALKKPEDNWSVRMIEDDFFNLMFE